MVTPACAHAIMVSPEQSKQVGPAPALQYGLPTWACAYATAAPARPLGGGGGPLEARLVARRATLAASMRDWASAASRALRSSSAFCTRSAVSPLTFAYRPRSWASPL